jgi:apolipoprotein N-acyltransferase
MVEPPAHVSAVGWMPWFLAVVSAVLQILIFPLPNLTFLCWIALAPLLVALIRTGLASQGRSRSAFIRGFLLGYVCGGVYYAFSCFWIAGVMHNYGGISSPVSGLILIGFCVISGSAHALFGGLLAFLASRPKWGTRVLVIAPFLWVAAEFYRARVVSFPWDLLGTVLVDNIPLSRIATVTGTYGLSLEILLVNAVFASAFLGRREKRTLVLAGCILFCGMLETGRYVEPPRATVAGTARLVQQNIPLNQQWTPDTFQATLADLERISVPRPGEGMSGDPFPDLIVWPESPAPFFETDPRVRQTLTAIAQQSHAYVLAGTLGLVREKEEGDVYNSAQVVAPDGEWLARYDKIHLVPFGEYIPFKHVLSFAGQLVSEVGNFARGTERVVIPVHSYKLGTFICYEATYPDEVREFAGNGATLLVTISNDGWFGDSAAPIQHLRMARMRAIENQRWVLRSTNTGVSASIDPYGRVVQQLRRNVRVAVDVPYGIVTSTTFYTRHGDWFAWMCVILCAIISLQALFSRQSYTARA